VDHVLFPEAQTLPALVVVRLPDGNTHFVVVWRRHGRFVQVMDPGTGRRWPTCRQLLDALYVHTMSIPATAWRAWAGSDECLDVLHRRLAQLGLARPAPRRVCSTPHLRIRAGGPLPPWTRRCAWSPPWYTLVGYAAASRQGVCLRRVSPTHHLMQQITH
jgi:hypothetical protein